MNYLIIMAGLPGTGKTTTAKKLAEKLDYKYLSQNDVRREHGMKKMPKSQPLVQRDIDRRIHEALQGGEGIIIDAANRYGHRRHQLYGVASSLGKNVLVLECVCSEEEAKRRMRSRPKGDGLVVDAYDPKVYDIVKRGWQDIIEDLHDFSNHVSCTSYNSEENQFKILVESDEAKPFLKELEKHLTS